MNNVPETKRSFQHSEEFEKLILLLDQSFDIVNARIPKKGINISKWEGKDKGKEVIQIPYCLLLLLLFYFSFRLFSASIEF